MRACAGSRPQGQDGGSAVGAVAGDGFDLIAAKIKLGEFVRR